jgi:hypothetical protein
VCSAAALPDELFARGQRTDEDKHHERVLMGDLAIEPVVLCLLTRAMFIYLGFEINYFSQSFKCQRSP